MKKFILILIVAANIFASDVYVVDTKSSNSYYKAVSDVFFFGNDEIIGINKSLEGKVKVNQNGISGTVLIDSGRFNTQNGKRDNHIREILNHELYPQIRFTIENESMIDGKLYLVGKLFVNGVTKSIKLNVKKVVKQNLLTYMGKLTIKYKDFNIEPPTFAGIIKQAKETIEIGAKVLFKKDMLCYIKYISSLQYYLF